MKQKVLILFATTIIISACAAPQETARPTNTPAPLTATPLPTHTPLPSRTPTPQPYYLEDGILNDLDELSGEFVIITDGIATLTTTAEGVIATMDGDGLDVYTFEVEKSTWVEVDRATVWRFVAPSASSGCTIYLVKPCLNLI